MAVWRVGYYKSPCDFTPHHLCAWNHRFDDPRREYRTIYAADKKETCLREVLADLRPNKKALADFAEVFGADPAMPDAGKVTQAWRRKHVLARADIEISSGAMARIEAPGLRAGLSRRLKRRVDAETIHGRDRDFTRAISRELYDGGHCGIAFRSRLDKAPCHALFEGRARLEQTGQAVPLADDVAELIAVCREYGLTLA